MKSLCSLIAVVIFIVNVSATAGDTTFIRVHDAVDMTWFGNYDEVGVFPDGSTSYNKILLRYTMGCASGGCSDWDYTTQIRLLQPTGVNDSTISGYDTISTSPLVIDTLWNVFEVIESYELGRAITPYGNYMKTGSNGFDNNWTRDFYYDVTDFVNLLKDSVTIRAHYSGWSSGFSVTTDFLFIEGTPSRPVLDVQNIYSGSWSYQNMNTFENTALPEKNFSLQMGDGYKIRVTPSGHGFDNNTNCAEFCERNYTINLNGNPAFQVNMWRDDCGLNAVYPQQGTWVYNRANWCPGDYVWTYEHEITHLVSALSTLAIDMNIDQIVWSGAQAPSYIIDAQLVHYGPFNFQNDMAMEQLIAPNDKYEFNRLNPICGKPQIKVKNYGENPVTSFDIEYWVEGGNKCWYEWTGTLNTGESETIELPPFDWNGMTSNVFYARVEWPNGVEDENPINDELKSTFALPDVLDSLFVIRFWTNTVPGENEIKITDESGMVVHQNTSFAPNTLHWDTISLSKGCYQLRLLDYDAQLDGGDGITWQYNFDGSGSFQLREYINSTQISSIIENFNPNFGSEIYKAFTVGYTLGSNGPQKQPCDEPVHNPSSIDESGQNVIPWKIYPNPVQSSLFIDWQGDTQTEITIWDAAGRMIHAKEVSGNRIVTFDMSENPSQMYIVKAAGKDHSYTAKFFLSGE